MSFQANVLKVMIASPEDVAEERKIVTGAIYRWNDTNALVRQLVLLPIKWETPNAPQLGASAHTVINHPILDDADIVIGIFGPRIGTPTDESIGGTIEEIKKHVAAGKTAKVYFSEVRTAQKRVDQKQHALVQKFREELNDSGLYAIYESMEQFRDDFEHHLALEMNQPRYRWLKVPKPDVGNDELSADALRMVRAVVDKNDGELVFQDKYGLHTDRANRTAADSQLKTPAIDEFQKNHVDELLRSVGCVQRDLLRFLLLKGGVARGDVIARARTIKNPLEMNGLCGPLEQKRLLKRTPEHKYGYSMLAVNEPMNDVLRESLLPREEDDPPFFEGI